MVHSRRIPVNCHYKTLIIIACLVLAGCSPMTLNTAEQKGGKKLNARDIFDLVSGNTLSLTAYDFDGTVYFSEQGRLGAADYEGQKDSGSWDIKDNDQLCLKFQIWYYGDINCYSVVADREANKVSLFTTNGAAYYTGTVTSGDSAALAPQISSKKSSSYLRQSIAEEKTGTTPAPQDAGQQAPSPPPAKGTNMATSSSVRQLAKKCNGCNLSGADLKEAILVKAELEGADLTRADLRYANLRRARLAGANLSGARLNHANLPGADLTGCDLRGADLSGANLLLTNFTGADLTGATLTNAHIENTIGLER